MNVSVVSEHLNTGLSSRPDLRAMRIEDHPRWRHNAYERGHDRVHRERGRASSCPWGHAGPFQWASLTGDFENPADYASMCISCHRRFDAQIRRMLGGTGSSWRAA